MKKLLAGILVLGIVLLVGQGGAKADIVYQEGFPDSASLNSWQVINVIINSGEAVLSDGSYLYKGVLLNPGSYALEFDFHYNLSTTSYYSENNFSFLDTFFASLYFISDMNSFNLTTPPLFGFGLFDLDKNGIEGLGNSGSISEPRSGVFHFRGNFNLTSALCAIPTFELKNLNRSVNSDSTVYIDNISIAIPEPSTLLLVGIGFLSLLGYRRKQKTIN